MRSSVTPDVSATTRTGEMSAPRICAGMRDSSARSHGDRSGRRAHQPGQQQSERRRDQVVQLGADRHRGVERSDRACDRRDRGLGLATALVEVEAGPEQQRRAHEGEEHARRLVDPPVPDRHHEEEHDSEEDRRASHPSEQASAKQIFEIECRRTPQRGSGPPRRRGHGRWRRRSGRGRLRGGRRRRSWWRVRLGPEHSALEPVDAGHELLDLALQLGEALVLVSHTCYIARLR